MDYDYFINNPNNAILDKISENDFYNLEEYILELVSNYEFLHQKSINCKDELVEFIMKFLLKHYKYRDITRDKFDDMLYKTIERFNNEYIKAAKSNKEAELTNQAYEYVANYISRFKAIFDSNVDINTLSISIVTYFTLEKKYRLEDIISSELDDEILVFIYYKRGNISFNPKYEEFKNMVANDVSKIFLEKKHELIDEKKNNDTSPYSMDYHYFCNPQNQAILAFKVATSLYIYDSEKAYNKGNLNSYISDYLNSEKIKSNSIIKRREKDQFKHEVSENVKKFNSPETKEMILKILAILLALSLLDKLIFGPIYEKQKNNNKERKAKSEMSVSKNNKEEKVINLEDLSYNYDTNEIIKEDDQIAKL